MVKTFEARQRTSQDRAHTVWKDDKHPVIKALTDLMNYVDILIALQDSGIEWSDDVFSLFLSLKTPQTAQASDATRYKLLVTELEKKGYGKADLYHISTPLTNLIGTVSAGGYPKLTQLIDRINQIVSSSKRS